MAKLTTEEKTDLILEAMRAEVTKFVDQQDQFASPTEYEDQVLEVAHQFAAKLITHSSDHQRKGRNAKKKS